MVLRQHRPFARLAQVDGGDGQPTFTPISPAIRLRGICDVPAAIVAPRAHRCTGRNSAGRRQQAAESGLPGFESTGWFGINAAFVAALNDPETIKRIHTLGSDPMPMSPSEFSAFIDKEIAKWGKVVEHATQKPN